LSRNYIIDYACIERQVREIIYFLGEKLDSKVVETLEAVFKRVQFVIMDLEATNLDDDVSQFL